MCAAATAAGYAFHTGLPHRINSTVRTYPAAWLEPPVLRSVAGRTEGSVTYRTVIRLMALPGSPPYVPTPAPERSSPATGLDDTRLSDAESTRTQAAGSPFSSAAKGSTPQQAAATKETLWAQLETAALGMARAVAADPAVQQIENISCIPAEGSLTAHGEISATLTCDITLWYYA